MANLKEIELKIPNLGEAEDTEVIEIPIKIGDEVEVNDPLLVLESEKAAMEVPSDFKGKVKKISVKEGDTVKEGIVFATIESKAKDVESTEPEPILDSKKAEAPVSNTAKELDKKITFSEINAGPAVRKIARELDIDLKKITGTGKSSMVTKEDLKLYIKRISQETVSNLKPKFPSIEELEQFGSFTIEKQSKIQIIGASNLHESWISIPHVTHFEEIDITNLEIRRKKLNESSKTKITPLAFLIKYVSKTLKEYKRFNSSLISNEEIMLKDYVNMGIAIDTDQGLIVPNIKDSDSLSEEKIAEKIISLADKAKSKKLLQGDLKGATFTISSLGSLGGSGFTPIINPPEVAIIGVSKAKSILVMQNGEIVEKLILPIALSYDHRVINGADAGRFMVSLKTSLESI